MCAFRPRLWSIWFEQKSSLQYREPSFGHGVLDIMNLTHARWFWNRNQDGISTYADAHYIERLLDGCPAAPLDSMQTRRRLLFLHVLLYNGRALASCTPQVEGGSDIIVTLLHLLQVSQ